MEQIVAKLLVPDSKVIEQGTTELKEAFKKPEAITALCEVVVSSPNAEIRQTAAVLLRRKFGKRNQWLKVELTIRNRIKQGMIQALVNENVKIVKNSIAQFIGILGKHEFVDNSWPEVLHFIHTLCNSSNDVDKELGMYVLSTMTEISKDSYIVHLESMGILFNNIINSLTVLHCDLAFYTVVTMKNIVPIIKGHQQMITLYHNLLPRILEIMTIYAKEGGSAKKVCEMLEMIEELIEFAPVALVPHIKLVVQVCLCIGSSDEVNDEIQIKVISVLGWLIRCKSKIVQKENLIEPIIDTMMKVMSQNPNEDNIENQTSIDPDEYTPVTSATQTLDIIALHLPPEKIIPLFLSRIEPAVVGNDKYAQKAAYLALGVLAEGCSEYIRKKYLQPFLKCVCEGINSEQALVRNAALFAFGQFAEHLQPEISQYSSELLPILLDHLSQMYSKLDNVSVLPTSLDRIFYALETFCENLDEALQPYLHRLMEQLFIALDPNHCSLQLKKMGFNAISSAASAVKEAMLPYFSKILTIINIYVNSDPLSENSHVLCDAIDCLATIALTIGNDHFKPLTGETLQLALRIIDNNYDPDNRRAAYALIGALAVVMKEELAPVVPNIVEQMIGTLQSSEGIDQLYEEETKDNLDVYDALSESDNDGEEDIENASSSTDSEQCQYMVENSYIDEKEQACKSLMEISANVGPAFLPFIEKSFLEVFKLLNFPHDDIHKAAIDTLQQFCISLYKLNTSDGHQALYTALNMLIPKCSEIIHCEGDRQIVMCALHAYENLLEHAKGEVLVGEGHREAIMNSVIDVLTLKTSCQEPDIDGGGDSEDQSASEQDELLLEYAGDIIPKFGKAITPEDFVIYFPNVLTLLGNRTKKQNSESQRSFSYGTLAECMQAVQGHLVKFVPQLLKLWFTGMKDSSDEVRNNSVYGLGEMILYGQDGVYPYYGEILQTLSSMVAKETHVGTVDNICGALAKLIIVNSLLVPLEQVFPAFLERLPIKEDFQENAAIVKCFYTLYQQRNQIVHQYLSKIIQVVLHIYANKQTSNPETEQIIMEFLNVIKTEFREEFTNCISAVPMSEEVKKSLL